MRLSILLLLMFLWSMNLSAQDSQDYINHQNWDLSYHSLLQKNQVRWDHSVGTLFTWLLDREEEQQYIEDFLQMQLSVNPEATFLIDHPTFPSAGRTTILGVKLQGQCFYWWRSTDEGMKEFKKRPMDSQHFNNVVERLSMMRQRGYENMGGPERAYAGFLSVFKDGKSRQILLHINDFMEFDVENQQILRVGKIFEIENSLSVKNN